MERYWEPIIHPDGTEQRFRFKAGAKRGFQYVREWVKSVLGTVLIVEGVADVAAAHPAGFIAFSRPTRAANLEPLKELLATLDPWVPIYVLCENDEIKHGTDPFVDVMECARKLSEALGREVYVVRCPPEFKDLNDWWKSLVDARCEELETQTGVRPKPHELSTDDYLELGRTQLAFFTEQAHAKRIAANRKRAEEFEQLELGKAEIQRHSNTEIIKNENGEDEKRDLDFEGERRCTYRLVLTESERRIANRKKNSNGADRDVSEIMGILGACGRWACERCRRRILVPTWTNAIVLAFSVELGAFAKWIPSSEIDRWIQVQQRKKAKWVSIDLSRDIPDDENLETEPSEGNDTGQGKALVLSTHPTKGFSGSYYDFLSDDPKQNLDAFYEAVRMAVHSVGGRTRRPIRPSHGIRVGKKATAEDWQNRIADVIRTRCEKSISTFGQIVTSEQAARIRSDAYQNARVVGSDAELFRIDFFTIELGDGKSIAITSKDIPGLSMIPMQPLDVRDPSKNWRAIFSAIKTGDEVKASSRWYAKPTTGWRATDIHLGPREIRQVAKRLKEVAPNVQTSTLQTSPVASMVAASKIRIGAEFEDLAIEELRRLDEEIREERKKREEFERLKKEIENL